MPFNKKKRFDVFKWKRLQNATFEGKFDMPMLAATDRIPSDLVPFHMTLTENHPEGKWFHFYEDDYQFERFWNQPARYWNILKL